VLYHGAPGTISHKACKQFFGSNGFESRASYKEVVEAVDQGQASLGILPLENSISGSLHENYDLLMEHRVQIVGEVNLKVVNNLIGWEGADLNQIKRVYAHSQVFEQCKSFLSEHPGWDLIASGDTVSNVKRVKDTEDKSAAAISSQEAADLFGMAVIKPGIDSNPRNFTRFAVISQGEFPGGPANKTSLIFTVSDKPGALFTVLSIFADREVNIVKLESRPLRDRPWEYLFYLDFELEAGDQRLPEILAEVEGSTTTFRNLGSYAKGPEIKS
jgi:3-deoxy-7-phosphoheptulonate synthase